MKISILTDNSKSWFVPYGFELKNQLEKKGHDVTYVFNKDEIPKGDICFLLSCSKIVENVFLQRNVNNIVVHASDLPIGKGFSPLQWQILEGKDEIVLTLFEVVSEVDAGPYYLKSTLLFNGTELYDELREKLAFSIINLCIDFVERREILTPIPQMGEESFYRKRTKADDQIDPNKTIAELFNHFRIADNDNYPLWFLFRGRKYYLKIYSE
jgi:methionyl-tRNA formyltransferase